MSFPSKGTHVTREMCFRCSATLITRDMCFPCSLGEHISLGICVSGVREHLLLGICVSSVGKHVSQRMCFSTRDMCFPGRRTHMTSDMCFPARPMCFFFALFFWKNLVKLWMLNFGCFLFNFDLQPYCWIRNLLISAFTRLMFNRCYNFFHAALKFFLF